MGNLFDPVVPNFDGVLQAAVQGQRDRRAEGEKRQQELLQQFQFGQKVLTQGGTLKDALNLGRVFFADSGGLDGRVLDGLKGLSAAQAKQQKAADSETELLGALSLGSQATLDRSSAGLPSAGPGGLGSVENRAEELNRAISGGVDPERVRQFNRMSQSRLEGNQIGQQSSAIAGRSAALQKLQDARGAELRTLGDKDDRQIEEFLIDSDSAKALGREVGERVTVRGRENINRFIDAGAKRTGQAAGISDTPENVLSRPVQAKFEEAFFGVQGTRESIASVREKVRPEFFSIPGRARIIQINARMGLGQTVTPEEEALVNDFAVTLQEAWGFANERIKQITGAQMSEPEAKRILREVAKVPDDFTDILTGGNFSNFMVVLDNMEEKLIAHEQRLRFALEDGVLTDRDIGSDGTLTPRARRILGDKFGIERMPQIISSRIDKEARRLRTRQPGLSERNALQSAADSVLGER